LRVTLNHPALSRLIAGLLVVCTVGWGSALFDTIKRARHSYYWDQAEGTVIWRGKMCEMSNRRDGQRRIRKADVIDCADVARYATDHPKQTWHSTDAHYVRINYFLSKARERRCFRNQRSKGTT
jgi:hypothetical protein